MELFNENFAQFKRAIFHTFVTEIYNSLHIAIISTKYEVMFILGGSEKSIFKVRERVRVDYFSYIIVWGIL